MRDARQRLDKEVCHMTCIKGGLLALFCVLVIGCGGQSGMVAPQKLAALQRGASEAQVRRQIGRDGDLLFRVMCRDQRVDAVCVDVSPDGKRYALIFANDQLWRIVDPPVFRISAESDPSRAKEPFYILDRVQQVLSKPDIAVQSSSPPATQSDGPDDVTPVVVASLPLLLVESPVWIPLVVVGGAENSKFATSGVSLGDPEARCDKRLGSPTQTWAAPDGSTWKRYQRGGPSLYFTMDFKCLTVRFVDGRAAGVFPFDMLDDSEGGQRDSPPRDVMQ